MGCSYSPLTRCIQTEQERAQLANAMQQTLSEAVWEASSSLLPFYFGLSKRMGNYEEGIFYNKNTIKKIPQILRLFKCCERGLSRNSIIFEYFSE